MNKSLLTKSLALAAIAAVAGGATLVYAAGNPPTNPGTAVTIPLAEGTANIDWNNATLGTKGERIQDGGVVLENTQATSWAELIVNNTEEQPYTISFGASLKDANATGTWQITWTSADGSETYVKETVTVTSTGNWSKYNNYTVEVPKIPVGNYKFKMECTGADPKYAGNFTNLLITPNENGADRPVSKIPGEMLFADATYNNCKLENEDSANPNVGYVTNGSSIVYNGVVCEEAGEYVLVAPLDHKGNGTLTVVVKDENGNVEATGVHNLIGQAHGNTGAYIPEEIVRFDNPVSAGVKTVELVAATSSSYAFNLYAPRFAAASAYETVNTLPGTVSLASTISGGGLRSENGGGNVGNIKDGYKAWNSNLKVAEAGKYKMTFNASSFYNNTDVKVSVINEADGAVVSTGVLNVTATGEYETELENIPAGSVTLALEFVNVPQNGGYCINYNKIAFEYLPVVIPTLTGDLEDGFAFEAEEGVEYKLIVNGEAYELNGTSFGADHAALATPGKVHELALGVGEKVGESIYRLTAPAYTTAPAENGQVAVTFLHEEGVYVLYAVGGYDEGLSTRSVGDVIDDMAAGFGMNRYTGEPVLVANGSTLMAVAVADHPADPENLDAMLTSPMAVFSDITTGVAEITADDLEGAEVYDLAGRRVNGEPAPGIYVFVKGGKSYKVVVR